jgi:hypothetical protein
MQHRLTLGAALAALDEEAMPFVVLFQHGSLKLEICRPIGADKQALHTRD